MNPSAETAPPGDRSVTNPVLPDPTVAMIIESDSTSNVSATEFPKRTSVTPVKSFPEIVITEPVEPDTGDIEVIEGTVASRKVKPGLLVVYK